MSLFDLISEDIKKAMLAKDAIALQTLRGVKKEFIEAKTAKDAQGELTDEQAVRILTKMVKQRKDAAEIFSAQNRQDLSDGELAEVVVIEKYLPKQMTDAQLTTALKEIISEVGATSAKEIGKVMGVASKKLAGKAEGKAISSKAKELLG